MTQREYIVKQENIEAANGRTYFVSTVCLNRHGFIYSADLPYETMIFDTDNADTYAPEIFCDRYAYRGEAMSGHARAVSNINDILGLDTSGNI